MLTNNTFLVLKPMIVAYKIKQKLKIIQKQFNVQYTNLLISPNPCNPLKKKKTKIIHYYKILGAT